MCKLLVCVQYVHLLTGCSNLPCVAVLRMRVRSLWRICLPNGNTVPRCNIARWCDGVSVMVAKIDLKIDLMDVCVVYLTMCTSLPSLL